MPGSASAGRWRTTRLLIRLKLIRTANRISARMRQPVGAKRATRKATPAKRRNTWIITLFVLAVMMFSAFNFATRALQAMERATAPRYETLAKDDDEDEMDRIEAASRADLHEAMANEWNLLIVAALLFALANRDLVAGDSELESLSSLPVKTETLMFARICERSVVNVPAFILLAPATLCLAQRYDDGFGVSALLAIAIVIPVMVLCAALGTAIDTGARILMKPAAMRNLQAMLGLASLLVLYTAMTPAMRAGRSLIPLLAHLVLPFSGWLPGSLITSVATEEGVQATLMPLALLWGEALLIFSVCLVAINALLRRGIVISGARESGRRLQARPAEAPPQRRHGLRLDALISPLQRRELRLLGRDRNFMIRSMVLPAIILIGNSLMNSGLQGLTLISGSQSLAASTAFGVAAYCLILSALQTLISEGRGLWLAYTFPMQLGDFLKDKARLWAVLTMIYPLVVYAFAFYRGLPVHWQTIELVGKVVLGISIFSFIATALGVFACDPVSEDTAARVRVTYVYLFMMLAGLYIYALAAAAELQSIIIIVLIGLFAQAIWQKARDDLPYLLDPSALPAPRVATADGLIAALLFFAMQILTFMMLGAMTERSDGGVVLLSFTVAGAVTYGMARLSYWRAKTVDVPAMFKGMSVTSAGLAIGLGLGVAVSSIGYTLALRRLGLIGPNDGLVLRNELPWLLPLAVIAAPLFEEFIFRGLIYGGLRRSQTRVFAVLGSAALFAILHPVTSMAPVLLFGVGAALLYQRSRALLAPMLAHAVYNAAMLSFAILGLPFLV